MEDVRDDEVVGDNCWGAGFLVPLTILLKESASFPSFWARKIHVCINLNALDVDIRAQVAGAFHRVIGTRNRRATMVNQVLCVVARVTKISESTR